MYRLMKELFYNPLSFKGVDPKNIFVWSDLHLGHDKEFLWKPRGFASVEEHDLAIKHRWQSNLDYDSIIFILGDIMFGHKADERLDKFFDEVPFSKIYLMGGNHHAGYKQLIQRTNCYGEYWVDSLNSDKCVQFIPNYIEAYVNKKFYVMSHYAILSANGQGKDNFGGMIHGHSHGNLYNNDYAKQIYNGKVIDVGVENVQSPMSFHELENFMNKKDNKSYDHHDSSTISPV